MVINGKNDPQGTFVFVDKVLYSKEAVLATAYGFTGCCAVEVMDHDDKHYSVQLTCLAVAPPDTLSKLASEFLNELIDQQLRVDLEKRTGELRKIIVEHAFSPVKAPKSKKK
jgi:His-Xaa-Ser system protein HxsD